MNVTLISVDQELYCIGVRLLSACLKQAGHRVRCVFMPAWPERDKAKFHATFSLKVLAEVQLLCADADLIGFSLMTNQFLQAACVTDYLKAHRITAPIIWGGIHPTVEPEACLEHADIVCLGEGEEALLELADRMERRRVYRDVRNLWLRVDEEIIRNPLRPLVQDLDALPLPDYSCQDHFLVKEGRVVALTPKDLAQFEGERFHAREQAIYYPVMTSRGCAFACTYCCNGVYKRLYPHQKRLRWRSVESVIRELKMIQQEVAPIHLVFMVDDNFTARTDRELEAFCEHYRAEVGLPFACQCSPLTINARKMEILLQAGCAKIVMGVETASDRVAEMYNRRSLHKAVPAAITLIEQYRSRMALPPSYQFIIDNPYETLSDTLQTLRLAVSLPRPWDNPIYSLMLFPGTPLYEKAAQDGLIQDRVEQIYGKNWLDQSQPFFRFWVRLYRANIPPVFLRVLLWPWMARLMTSRVAHAFWRMGLVRWL